MVKLPDLTKDPTLTAAEEAAIEAASREEPRAYLGMSSLGDECERRLWYKFHRPAPQRHPARTLFAFADGHLSEDVIIARLRLVSGVTLLNIDPDTGKQFGLSDFDGKLKGHMDGVILGLLQAPSTWHVFEAKCTNEKSFAKLLKLKEEKGEKEALLAWNPVYWSQAQLYMGYADLTRHYTVICTPGARDWTSVRTEFNLEGFIRLKEKARRIIEAPYPLARISNDPAWYVCKWCDHHAQCHKNEGGSVA